MKTNGWGKRYIDRYYRSRPGWVDGTTQFHQVCRKFLRKDSRVLELGPGPANKTSKFLSLESGYVVGLDIDGSCENSYLREVRSYDGCTFPFSDASFDVVVADYVIEHLERPLETFREVRRVLRDGGVFIFRTPNLFHYVSLVAMATPHWFHELVANRLRGLAASETHPHLTYHRANTSKSIRRTLGMAGFNVIFLELIEKEPSYGMYSKILFIAFMLYERLVNSTERLAAFRSNFFCVARK